MSPLRKKQIRAENLRLRAAGRATENDEQLEAIEFRLRQLLAEVNADLAGQALNLNLGKRRAGQPSPGRRASVKRK